ncbi:MAG: caspase family protein, partial [Candidatus Competibacteraceae bacterium]|nr:caspase family protein [Candidatus Competibacteraceae bacterium]
LITPIFTVHGLRTGLLLACILWLNVACLENPSVDKQAATQMAGATTHDPDSFLVVDCLLPGQLRKLGMTKTYLTARRAIRTAALDCEIRGGEYVTYDRANYATALKVWLPIAEKGDLLAQVYVGEIFEKGMGIQPDYTTAARWYRKAAEQGSARAQVSLGFLYERGLGVNRDLNTALNWYRKAAGMPEAIVLESQSPMPKTDDSQIQMELAHERQSRAALERQLAEARQEMERQRNPDYQGDSETFRQLETQLRQREEELQRQKQEVAKLENEVAQSREQAGKAAVGATETSETIKQLETQLRQREEELQQQKQEVARLESEIVRSRQQADKTTLDAVDTGPQIELIEPPVRVTRDASTPVIKTRSGLPRVVVGRVTALAGIASLSINNQQIDPDIQGLFRTEVSVTRSNTPVEIIAVDKKGRTGSLRVVFVPESLEATVLAGESRVAPPKIDTTAIRQQIDFGDYYALVIGNENYQHLQKLDTPISDANAIAKLLRERYGFSANVLTDANRQQILTELNELRRKLTEKDNLLIYYAGHGTLETVNQRGYWQPVDAEQDNTANWISTLDITDILNVMSAKGILVVADSCYSGAMTRSSVPNLQVGISDEKHFHWLKQIASKRSRTVLTSGGLGPVLDAGGGGHSVFSKALLNALESNSEIIEGQKLYRNVAERVSFDASKVRFEQIPQYAAIKNAGHEAGDFLFIPK